ncbi:hypothetical protein GCU54_03020 [Geodermatophilus normandii]|uniref:DUF2269 domain-containing protein n=2 Tax=Geodermatophilus normandii TaxID=1137989 RepID=A0A6P0GDE5_9ACTN|nr:hypothetical protein [Geodermatophilus normandii]
MSPGLRRLALTAHVTTSVGWLGAVAAFLALAVAGLAGEASATVRGAYVAADVLTWAVIVPLCLASLLTGVVQSLGTPWGLVRHWWVLVKLVLTVAATGLLLLHTQPISHLGDVAATGGPFGADLGGMRLQLVVDAAAALLVLLGATALAVVKPRGRTGLGRRPAPPPPAPPRRSASVV